MAVKKLKKKVTKKSRKLPRDFKPSTKNMNSFDTMVLKTAEEVEDYLMKSYIEEDDDIYDLPSMTEMQFCHAYLSNGFKQGPAIRTILPESTEAYCTSRAQILLSRDRVQRYLSNELHSRRLKMGVTAAWICKKYLAWSTLDVTEFLDFTPNKMSKNGDRVVRKASVFLKGDIADLPRLVRQAIKSLTIDDKGKVKVEFIDQKSALDSLAKMLGYANDKLTMDAKLPIHLHFDQQDSEA